jgi:hypothetical protein
MATTWRELVKGAALTGSPTSVYTAPALTFSTITAASANNSTASAITVNIYLVPAGQTVANAYRIASKAVAANSTGQFPEIVNHKLEPGAQIFGDGAGANITISGAEYVPNT